MTPKVSVVLVTYNQEKYIAESINSLLLQNFSDFELIIVDDGSTDNTRIIVEGFSDNRIIYFYQKNSGTSSASNFGISKARSEYISLMSGDDKASESRLKIQYDYFLQHPETTILFGRCKIIDENSNLLKGHALDELFNKTIHIDRYALFYQFFFNGNCLNAVTCMMRKSVFDKTKGFQIASLQLQDYFLWFEWLKLSDIALLDDVLVYYRVRDSELNLSSNKNKNRGFFESRIILENILDNIDIAFFKKAFSNELLKLDFSSQEAFELEKSFLYLKHPSEEIQKIGLKKLFFLLQNPMVYRIYCDEYGFTMRWYYDRTNKAMRFGVKKVVLSLLRRLSSVKKT